jgi:hypothetical protein
MKEKELLELAKEAFGRLEDLEDLVAASLVQAQGKELPEKAAAMAEASMIRLLSRVAKRHQTEDE